MNKTLITIENLDTFICCGKLLMDTTKILTAGARDELIRRKVELVYGDEGQVCDCQKGSYSTGPAACCATNHAGDHASAGCQYNEEMLIGVAAIIKEHYGITDPEVLRKVTLETAAAISGQK